MAHKFDQGPTVRGTRVEANIPFTGFYESRWSRLIDAAEEREVENYVEDKQEEEGIAAELRLDACEYSGLIFEHTDYRAAYEAIARDYVKEIAREYSDALGFKLTLEWSTMVSPREYNFTTDRLFATMSRTAVRRLFAISKRDGHKALSEIVAERFTSYDGYHSHYKNTLKEWLDVPLDDWDENEICTLLMAALKAKGFEHKDAEWRVYERMSEYDYEYLEAAVDWRKVDAGIEELRADKAAELRADDPEYVAPEPRCPYTLDMFKDI